MAIPQTFDEAFERAKQLVSIFSENEGKYLSPGYSEAQARLEFIDKFWIALGWDVNRETQHDPYKQEVQVERGVATSEFRKRADYAFLAPNFRDVSFFVEAKKPHAGIDSPEFYFQTIRYGWNSHTPLAVLTDFEELRVLDCRYKPDIRSALGHAVLKFHYHDYADKEKFRAIYHLFSRESVLNGSIENFAKGMPKLSRKRLPRGVAADAHQSIDESFLQELDDFREELARAYKRKNPELDSAELTEVTQRTLDRLVFMRFLEDKLIEAEPLIEDLHKPGHSWENFIATSRRLDRIYNGIIFKEHTLLDSDSFKADERVFDKISQSLSHAGSPYDFNAIPIHILGSIYERFLGKVIVATDKRATVKEKPDVRKAGGVYYTPEYIVRYIVDNTVGKLIEGKTPAEIQEMRFADIACGSGSFLLGVYDTLLRYHTAYYNRTKRNSTEGIKAGCTQRPDGALQLSLLQKRQILLNNIYGVDIDLQAVEVAQLSLYLKLLEDETIASAHQQQLALREALLPSLSKNIVCGNSLIGWDITEGKLFDTADERGLNPMNFEDAFPEAMKSGGFDAIVGNPPYIYTRNQGIDPIQKQYFYTHYNHQSTQLNTFNLFVERAHSLLRVDGALGFITPNNWLTIDTFSPLRRFILEKGRDVRIVNILDHVFAAAQVDTAICTLRKGEPTTITVKEMSNGAEVFSREVEVSAVKPPSFIIQVSLFRDAESINLLEKVESCSVPLSSVSTVSTGLKAYQTGKGKPRQTDHHKRDRVFHASEKLSDTYWPYLEGADVQRFHLSWSGDYLSYGDWLAEPRRSVPFSGERILVRQIPYKLPYLLHAAFADQHCYNDINSMIVFSSSTPISLKYLLGLLNSRLLSFWFYKTYDKLQRKIFPQFKVKELSRFPIRRISFSELTDRALHDRMVQLVDQMLEAKKQLAAARSEGDKNFYESKCATLDRQIDNLVYELYDLTPDEIAIVEGSGK